MRLQCIVPAWASCNIKVVFRKTDDVEGLEENLYDVPVLCKGCKHRNRYDETSVSKPLLVPVRLKTVAHLMAQRMHVQLFLSEHDADVILIK